MIRTQGPRDVLLIASRKYAIDSAMSDIPVNCQTYLGTSVYVMTEEKSTQ